MSYTAWKRRIAVGTTLLCVEHTKRPELINESRRVTEKKSQWLVCECRHHPRSWTSLVPASRVTMLDEDTARLGLDPKDPGLYVSLRIVKE